MTLLPAPGQPLRLLPKHGEPLCILEWFTQHAVRVIAFWPVYVTIIATLTFGMVAWLFGVSVLGL